MGSLRASTRSTFGYRRFDRFKLATRGSVSGHFMDAPLELTGRRLLLRPLEADDYIQFKRVTEANADTLRSRGVGIEPDLSADAFAELCEQLQFGRELGIDHYFGIFHDGSFIGEIALMGVSPVSDNATLAAWLAEDMWGNEFVEEAFDLVCDFGFDQLGLHRIESLVLPDNVQVQRALEKVGIGSEGLGRALMRVEGEWVDAYRYAVTDDDWQRRTTDAQVAT